MILADVNVLIYAFRADVPQHPVCRSWLTDIVSGSRRFGLSPLVLSALVRITTNPRAFREPSTTDEAFAFCNALLGQPHAERIEPGGRHWAIFQDLCRKTGIRGPILTDAWFAALAIESNGEWVTTDRDFARFPGLTWRMPDGRASATRGR